MTDSLTKELSLVEAANLRFYQAFSLRDLELMGKVWAQSPHARCVHPGWELCVGWSEIRQSWQEVFQFLNSIDFELEDVHVEVSGPTAWVNHIVFVNVTTQDGESFYATVVTTNIFEKSEDEWRLVLHHSSNFADGEEEAEEEDFEFPSGPPSSGPTFN